MDDLTHYSSDNYDPAKAHEYYMKNRDLKGDGNTAPKNESKDQRKARLATSQKQREGIAYAKKQIGDKKKAESKAASEAQKDRLLQLRGNADASRIRIEENLNKLLEKIRAKANIPEPKPVKLIPLNQIPPNATPERRAYLEKQNAAISKVNQSAQKKAAADFAVKKAAAQKAVATETAAAKDAMRTQMRKVGEDLKAAITTARDSYKKATEERTAKYKTAAETEEKNIKANVR